MALYAKDTYTADMSYLVNTFIYEYDISKCNINILKECGLLDQATYDYLYNAERMVRQVYVGKLQKDKVYKEAIKNGLYNARKNLFEANGLVEKDILSIKKDAVFVLNRQLAKTQFGMINFLLKNQYTSFFKIRNCEYYYYYNKITKQEKIDVKGIDDNVLLLHEGYMLAFIKDVFYFLQVEGPDVALRVIQDFYNEYIKLELSVPYYRPFDPVSMFHFKVKTAIGTGFSAEMVEESMKPMLDITYNLSIIIELQKIVLASYFEKHR